MKALQIRLLVKVLVIVTTVAVVTVAPVVLSVVASAQGLTPICHRGAGRRDPKECPKTVASICNRGSGRRDPKECPKTIASIKIDNGVLNN